MPKLQGFIGGSYGGISNTLESERCVNLFVEMGSENAKNAGALIGTPGLKEYSLIPSLAVNAEARGMVKAANGNLYAVIGASFCKILATTSSIISSTMTTTTGVVRFAENAAGELLIVDGTDGYVFNTITETSFTKIPRTGTNDGFPTAPTHCCFIAGYILVNDGVTGNVYFSGIDDCFTWNSLNFFNAEGSPDQLTGIIANRNEVWLIGAKSTEVWAITGEVDEANRFQRIPGALGDVGTISPNTILSIQNSVFFIGSDFTGYGRVYRSNGYQMEEVTTPAISYEISKYTDIATAKAFTCTFHSHIFYVLVFETSKQTWVYDLSTGMWFEWLYWNSTDSVYEHTLAIFNEFYDGKNLVFNRSSYNRVYELSLDVYTDNTAAIRRMRICPHTHAERKRIYYHRLEIDFERGTGLNTGTGSDPQIMLQISNDGGFSYGNELWSPMGRLGQYRASCVWNRLGYSQDRVYKLVITDPVKIVLVDALIEVTVGIR